MVAYTGTAAQAITPVGLCKDSEVTAGVLQGGTLAPFIFVIAIVIILCYEMQSWKREKKPGSRQN